MSLSKSDGQTLSAAEVNTFTQLAATEAVTGQWTFSNSTAAVTVDGRVFLNMPASFGDVGQFILTDQRATHGADYLATWFLNSDSDHSQGHWFGRTSQTTFFVGTLRSVDDYRIVADPGGTPKINARFMPDGGVIMPNLPTSDPLVAGELWNDSGTLKVSAG